MRHRRLLLPGLLLGVLCAGLAAPAPGQCPAQPNIVILYADDLAWAELPIFSPPNDWSGGTTSTSYDARLRSPSLNRLAARTFADASGALGPFQPEELSFGIDQSPPLLPPYLVVPIDNTTQYSAPASNTGCATTVAGKAIPSGCVPRTDVLARRGGLERMAQEGVAFSHFYSSAAICSPARASLLTGRHMWDHGVSNASGDGDLDPSETTIAEYLSSQPAAYQTGYIGKWHNGLPPPAHGFQDFVGFSGHSQDQFKGSFAARLGGVDIYDYRIPRQSAPAYGPCNDDTWASVTGYADPPRAGCAYSTRVYRDLAKAFIDHYQATSPPAPYLLLVAFQATHKPRQAPARTVRHYETTPGGRPAGFDGRAKMPAMIEELDAAVGTILAHLEGKCPTVVFFTSDHGSGDGLRASGDPALRGSKGTIYERGIRVGMLAWSNDEDLVASQYVRGQIGSAVDLFSTVVDYAGKAPSSSVRGVSLRPLLQGTAGATGSDYVFASQDLSTTIIARPGLPIPAEPAAANVCAALPSSANGDRPRHGGSCQSCQSSAQCASEMCTVPDRVCLPTAATGVCPGGGTCSQSVACPLNAACRYSIDAIGDRCSRPGDCPGGTCATAPRVQCTACVAANWKLNHRTGRLYDLSANPEESDDAALECSDEHLEVVDQLSQRLDAETVRLLP